MAKGFQCTGGQLAMKFIVTLMHEQTDGRHALLASLLDTMDREQTLLPGTVEGGSIDKSFYVAVGMGLLMYTQKR